MTAALSLWRIGVIYLEQARTGGSAEHADLPPRPVTLHHQMTRPAVASGLSRLNRCDKKAPLRPLALK
jgi:hypothetical protein